MSTPCRRSSTSHRSAPGEPVKIADIARRQHIPQKFLELILSGLKQAGFVESRRGAEGGYLLARPPDRSPSARCCDSSKGRPRAKAVCAVRLRLLSPMWQDVDRAVSDIVDHTTFADLLRRWTEKQNKFVPNWEI